jgi:orotidine-5'-phosphate decarboxylase
MSQPLDQVIVALDYDRPEKAFRLVDEIGELIQWYKVGPVLFTQSGPEVVQFLHRRGKKIFLDLKLHDTPNVVAETVKQLGDMGAQFATVHCLGGRRMLEAASLGCRGSQIKLLGVTLLTSQGAGDSREWAGPGSDDGMVLRLLELALQSRLAGILCSPHEIAAVRARTLRGFLLATPGIRLPGQEVYQDDQRRFSSPSEALAWGADYLIIGRPITQAREPREAVERLFV